MKMIAIALFATLFFSCLQDDASKRRVFDSARLIEDSLENKLEDHLYKNAIKKNEIYVLIILRKEFYSENYEDSFFNVLDDGRTNSVLIFLSYEDRLIRIMTNEPARKNLSDSTCKVIITQMTPYFSAGEYAEGINHGVDLVSLYIDKKR